jgi:hypothetical protein
VDFNITHKLLIIYLAFFRYWGKWKYNRTVHELFIDFEKVYDSVSILIKFGIPTKLIKLFKMCLNNAYNKVRIG